MGPKFQFCISHLGEILRTNPPGEADLLGDPAAALLTGSVIDGEFVALDAQDRPDFSAIQNSRTNGARVVFFGFDILYAGQTRRSLTPGRATLFSRA
jgi:hypothetical protein